ncbi:hypothetical protein F0562_021854 [Nyssa sinensis]|uniref:GH18 domain-containing protein n=1 Tax=Nyssa sinensis TaxID=561372 RepID=A0A5J5BM80_9ASTE|nr:hypothetical protein F0562_021854 [Nyssa sinensis]
MEFSKLFTALFILQAIFFLPSIESAPTNSSLFREYIGAEFNNVKFSDVPINSNVEFHFILAFAIDYTTSSSPSPTNGQFNIFWDTDNLSPSQVSSIKSENSNVKVALSLGGDSVGGGSCYFNPSSIDSWVSNAVSSLTSIINEYNLDGIDIDYEHFNADPDTFAECIGRLITTLKQNGVISFASIAPFDDDQVQSHYMALWKSYGHLIDYVNFQFYAYDKGTTVSEFMNYFDTQSSNYEGGKILASFISDGSGGLSPGDGFFTACSRLKTQQQLHGIFVWSADDSKAGGPSLSYSDFSLASLEPSTELPLVARTPSAAAPLGSHPMLTRAKAGSFKMRHPVHLGLVDVPINSNIEFHFILAFAIDYTTSSSPSPTNGQFNVFWDTDNLSPSQVSSIKSENSNVKVALSLGGDCVRGGSCYFNPSSLDSWVSNAVSSLTSIINEYNLDGINIDYEDFSADPDTFAECIGS